MWFKVDDRFWAHPKVALLARSRWYHEALSLWLSSGSWAGSALTDGVIPSEMLPVFRAKPRAAEALLKVGLWERVDGGYRFVDWADYQPSSAVVRRNRERTRERTKRWRERARDAVTDTVTEPVTNDVRAPSPILNPIQEEEEKRERAVWGLEVPPLRAPAHAYTREAQPAWTAERQAVEFRRTYLTRRRSDPAMGGKNLSDFHQRVLETAKAREMTPEKLFAETLEMWLKRDLNRQERSAPYACFANAFGELVDTEASGISPEVKRMQEQAAEALRIVRGGR